MKRNEFIRSCSLACAGALISPALLQSCKTTAALPYEKKDNRIVVKKNDLGDKPINILRVENLQAPIAIIYQNGEYSALFMQCTHKQCEVTYAASVFHCPCHGGEFDMKGNVLQGPPQKPLTQFKVSSDEKNIYLQ